MLVTYEVDAEGYAEFETDRPVISLIVLTGECGLDWIPLAIRGLCAARVLNPDKMN